jgi:arylformamidase
MAGDWIDISIPLKSGMVHWPGDPEVRVERVLAIDRGDPCNVSSIVMGSHTGTHMDPPFHYLRTGPTLDAMPLNATVGPARVIAIDDQEAVKPDELARHDIKAGERILLKTRNSAAAWQTDDFLEDFVYISLDGARYLAERRVRAVGVDYLSVGGYRADGEAIHHALLEAGIWIIEGLNLAEVEPGNYELLCLPIKIQHADGAPARAILRPLATAALAPDR